ncbi:MAG: S4 domain-containing protein, partial [Elusimicrobiales bacterium]|nr:S4 domain-containing protein [Elusimicrobiales bacterium]
MENKKIDSVYTGESQRIDVYLKTLLPRFSRQLIKEIIEKGKVKVNLKLVKPSYKLKDGDRIEIFFVENEEKSSIKLSDILVYEDSDIMI